MPDASTLGGRLPLAERSSLTPAQRELFDRYSSEVVPWAQRAGFMIQSREGALIGPLNPSLESPEISASFWDYQVAEERHTTLSDRERQVVVLAVGAIWQSHYELYAHSAAARAVGLTSRQVDTLISGGMPDHLSTREQCAHRLTCEVVTRRRIEQPLYDEAVELFGTSGITDMLYLVGAYQTVCGLLNAFAVPVPDERDE